MKSLVAYLALFSASLALAGDVAGKWQATAQTPDGQDVQIVFNIKQDGEKLTGTAEGPMGEAPITEGTSSGDSISFTVEMNDMKIVHKGTVAGDEMKLKVEIGDQTMNMTAKRVK